MENLLHSFGAGGTSLKLKLRDMQLERFITTILLLIFYINPCFGKPDDHTGTTASQRVSSDLDPNSEKEFICVQVPGEKGWRPQTLRKKGHNGTFPPLGRHAMPDKKTCERAVEASANGVVCSFTGVEPDYKPTHFSGSTEYRRDFGFWGSSTTLENCLIATRRSSQEKICYWGGEAWFIGDIKGSKKSYGGGFKTVQQCVESYQ